MAKIEEEPPVVPVLRKPTVSKEVRMFVAVKPIGKVIINHRVYSDSETVIMLASEAAAMASSLIILDTPVLKDKHGNLYIAEINPARV